MPFQGFPLLEVRALKKKNIRVFSTRRAAKAGGEKCLPKRAVLE